MKRTGIAIISFLMSLTLLFSADEFVFADKADEGSAVLDSIELRNVPTPEKDSFGFTDDQTRKMVLKQEDTMPSSYSLVDEGYITPVRLQSPFGTCWAFAAIAAAESSIISSGLAGTDLDLSEKHVAYFARSAYEDPDSDQNGEGYFGEGTGAEKLNTGGIGFLASSVFASGAGPVKESDDPYFEYKGEKGLKSYHFIEGANRPYCYSALDNWDIPGSMRNRQAFSLKESYILPAPAAAEGRQYRYEESATAAIKEQLLAGRAVEIGFLADKATPDQGHVESVTMSDDWANYGTMMNYSNHAVTIVGWDDTIGAPDSPVQYKEGKKPEGPGAWLVKNSWGAGTEPFPNRGDADFGFPVMIEDEDGNEKEVASGYFWLSYYDRSLCDPEAVSFEAVDPEIEMAAYDYMPAVEMVAKEFDGEAKMSNVFRTKKSEQLEQISFYTTHPGCTVHYEVYLMEALYEDRTVGLKVAEGDQYYKYGGFHKAALGEPVKMFRDQIYSIVVTEKTAEGRYTVNIPTNFSDSYKGIINSDESAVYMNGSWEDLSDKPIQRKIGKVEDYPEQEFDNFAIKGYTRPIGSDFQIDVSGDRNLSPKEEEKSRTLTASVEGMDDEAAEKIQLRWRLGNEDLGNIETSDGGFKAVLSIRTGEDGQMVTGNTFLMVDAYIGDDCIGRYVTEVRFRRPTIEFMYSKNEKINETKTAVYTGKPFTPEMEVDDNDGEVMRYGNDYTIKYSNNVKCGRAVVTATSAGFYAPGSLRWTFTIKPAKAKINKIIPGRKKLTVKVKSQKSSGISGYQVSYRKAGSKKWRYKTFKAGSSSLVLKKLKKGKKYQVRVRAFVKVKAKKYYGAYSKTIKSRAVK